MRDISAYKLMCIHITPSTFRKKRPKTTVNRIFSSNNPPPPKTKRITITNMVLISEFSLSFLLALKKVKMLRWLIALKHWLHTQESSPSPTHSSSVHIDNTISQSQEPPSPPHSTWFLRSVHKVNVPALHWDTFSIYRAHAHYESYTNKLVTV